MTCRIGSWPTLKWSSSRACHSGGVMWITAPHVSSRDRFEAMLTLKSRLDSRTFDELVKASERLALADNDLRWALIEARKRAGYTQRELAEILGVSQPTVANFERQDNDPRLSTLRRYALAVGADIRHQVLLPDGAQVETASWRACASVEYIFVSSADPDSRAQNSRRSGPSAAGQLDRRDYVSAA